MRICGRHAALKTHFLTKVFPSDFMSCCTHIAGSISKPFLCSCEVIILHLLISSSAQGKSENRVDRVSLLKICLYDYWCLKSECVEKASLFIKLNALSEFLKDWNCSAPPPVIYILILCVLAFIGH